MHESTFNSRTSALATLLYPIVEFPGTATDADPVLWRTMGGAAGVWRMSCDAIGFICQANELRVCLEWNDTFIRDMIWTAMYLWLGTWGCLLEAAVVRLIPTLPRLKAQHFSRLYCEVTSYRDNLIELRDYEAPALLTGA